MRRGKPSLNALHGVPLALNAGDLLLALSMRPLIENRRRLGGELAARIFDDALRTAYESAEGQALELGWRDRNSHEPTPADYLTMVLKKTCWLATIFPLRAGALIGSGGGFDLEPLIRLGFFLGAAFQIKDDLLNLQPGKHYGKELNGDLFEGKRTLIIIHLLEQAETIERRELIDILTRERAQRTVSDVRRMIRLIDKYGSREYAYSVAQDLAGAAMHEFQRAYNGLPRSDDLRFIELMASWVIMRD
jgi:geranylgeranyl diphosphate synthase type II